MDLYFSFLPSEQSPFEDTQTKVDCRGVKRIHVPAEFEDISSTTLLRLGNDPIGKFLEDPVVSVGVGFRQVALGSRLPEPQVIGFRPMRLSGQYDIPKALSVRQLAEHQHGKLVPAGEVLDVMITTVSICYSEEYILVDEI